MEILAFTVVAIGIYIVSDRLLDRAEIMAGRRFKYRQLIFFAIILVLASVSFALIQTYMMQAT